MQYDIAIELSDAPTCREGTLLRKPNFSCRVGLCHCAQVLAGDFENTQ
jgi:hypothetical protein